MAENMITIPAEEYADLIGPRVSSVISGAQGLVL